MKTIIFCAFNCAKSMQDFIRPLREDPNFLVVTFNTSYYDSIKSYSQISAIKKTLARFIHDKRYSGVDNSFIEKLMPFERLRALKLYSHFILAYCHWIIEHEPQEQWNIIIASDINLFFWKGQMCSLEYIESVLKANLINENFNLLIKPIGLSAFLNSSLPLNNEVTPVFNVGILPWSMQHSKELFLIKTRYAPFILDVTKEQGENLWALQPTELFLQARKSYLPGKEIVSGECLPEEGAVELLKSSVKSSKKNWCPLNTVLEEDESIEEAFDLLQPQKIHNIKPKPIENRLILLLFSTILETTFLLKKDFIKEKPAFYKSLIQILNEPKVTNKEKLSRLDYLLHYSELGQFQRDGHCCFFSWKKSASSVMQFKEKLDKLDLVNLTKDSVQELEIYYDSLAAKTFKEKKSFWAFR